GLLYAHIPNKALTWMDSYIDGQPVTQRAGYAVEVNALWYNAITFSMEIEAFSKPSKNGKMLSQWIDTFPAEFSAVFWNEDSSELADCVFEGVASWDVRPNITIAAAMPYSPLNDDQKMAVLDVVNKELLTPRGLRTLSPRSIGFKHSYEGDHHKRDLAYHQGTVWPWLLGFYAEAWLNLYEGSGRESIERLVQGFEEDLIEHGIGNISEVYDGSPPYRPCGAISFAASVAELMRIQKMLE
ncbi:MAG: hypothetical protein K9J24_16395, partial [Bacteroidales bacterium]|nr:hypothetical protein [Bacteroidales bacterium]